MDINDFAYYTKYKNNLTQYILYNCTTKNQKKRGRINLTELQLLSLLKELTEISLYIEGIKKNN
jgi:hypothetical protein